jgi:hypothetical protein
MRWTPKELDTRWHPWFAWRPVCIHGTWIWLETVERALRYACDTTWYEYRE